MTRKPRITVIDRSRRGAILPVAFFLCMIAAVSAILMFNTLLDHQKLNHRQREIANAYFAAEAGVQQVLNWGVNPSQYTPNTTLFYRNLNTGEFPSLSTTTLTSDLVLEASQYGQFTSDYGYDVSHVASITLLPKDAANDPVDCLFKVRSIGESTRYGIQREIVAFLQPNPLAHTEVKLPAAIISMAEIGMGGNGNVHWGEAWSKSDFQALSKPQCDHYKPGDPDYDQWVKIRCEGDILFDSTWKVGANKDVYDPYNGGPTWDPSVPLADGSRGYDPAAATLPDGSAGANGDFEGAFRSNVPEGDLEFPDFASYYETFKEQAKEHGRYYTTQAGSTSIYKDGVAVDLVAELAIPDGESRADAPYDLVFIDTIDGNPPAADGSNLADVRSTGAVGVGFKGVFWAGCHVYVGGSGSPEDLVDVEKPDGTLGTVPDVFLDGVLYSAGTMDLQGNPIIFGCAIAEKGFASGGTPEVYYNHKLKDGLELPKGNIGSVFNIVLQRNRGV